MTFPILHLAKLFLIVFQHYLGPSHLKMRRKELIWDTLPFVQWTHRDVQTLMMHYIVLLCPMEIFRYLSFNLPPLLDLCYSHIAFWRFFRECFVAWFLVYFQVGVHIADVSHFIRPGTAIDKEAANRSTTVYLTDRRIDMVIFNFFTLTPLNKIHFLLNMTCVVQKCVKRIEHVIAPHNLTFFLLYFLGSRVTVL